MVKKLFKKWFRGPGFKLDKNSAVRRAVEGSKVFLRCYFIIILAFNSHNIAPRQCAQAIKL